MIIKPTSKTRGTRQYTRPHYKPFIRHLITQCWYNVGPASQTLALHSTNIGLDPLSALMILSQVSQQRIYACTICSHACKFRLFSNIRITYKNKDVVLKHKLKARHFLNTRGTRRSPLYLFTFRGGSVAVLS